MSHVYVFGWGLPRNPARPLDADFLSLHPASGRNGSTQESMRPFRAVRTRVVRNPWVEKFEAPLPVQGGVHPSKIRPITVLRFCISEGLTQAESWFPGVKLSCPLKHQQTNIHKTTNNNNNTQTKLNMYFGLALNISIYYSYHYIYIYIYIYIHTFTYIKCILSWPSGVPVPEHERRRQQSAARALLLLLLVDIMFISFIINVRASLLLVYT